MSETERAVCGVPTGAEVNTYIDQHYIDLGPLHGPAKLAAEAGEALDAAFHRAQEYTDEDSTQKLYEELGDVGLSFLAVCDNEGWNPDTVITDRWRQVLGRGPRNSAGQA